MVAALLLLVGGQYGSKCDMAKAVRGGMAQFADRTWVPWSRLGPETVKFHCPGALAVWSRYR